MDKKEEEKLLRWFEENDDNILLDESEHNPNSDNREFNGDSDYVSSDSLRIWSVSEKC